MNARVICTLGANAVGQPTVGEVFELPASNGRLFRVMTEPETNGRGEVTFEVEPVE